MTDLGWEGKFAIEQEGKGGSGSPGLLMKHSIIYFTVTCVRADWAIGCIEYARLGVDSFDEARETCAMLGWKPDRNGAWVCPNCISAHGLEPTD